MFGIKVTLLLHLFASICRNYKWGEGHIKMSFLDLKMVDTFHVSSNVMSPRCKSELESAPSKMRRRLFHVAGYSSFIETKREVSWASTPTDVGEAIRYSASKIPGYGPSDIYYPINWKGQWNVRREVLLSGSLDPIILEYQVRFIQSIQDDACVSDRGYNQINLEKSIRPQQIDYVRSYKWTETNPNDLIIEFNDGSRKYIKITKRSTELDDKLGTISSSEFQRLTQDSREGIPIITARRIINKWKPIGVNLENELIKIEGLELVYEMGDGGDPLSFPISPQQQQPKLLSKSKLILDRIQ